MELRFADRTYAYGWWAGEALRSSADTPAAWDCETAAMRVLPGGEIDPLDVPRLALAMAFDGVRLTLVHPTDLPRFLRVNRSACLVGHNVAFDFWVADKYLRGGGDAIAARLLWDAADKGRLADSMVLDLLLQLGTGKYRRNGPGGDEDTKVYPANLAVLAEECGVGELDKSDPYRLRYGELVGLSKAEIEAHPEFTGFAEYALKDVIATRGVYVEQRKKGVGVMRAVGVGAPGGRYEIAPDAMKWGPLTEAIQVRASIALAELSRTPLPIDRPARDAMEAKVRAEYEADLKTLEAGAAGLWQRYAAPKARVAAKSRATEKTLALRRMREERAGTYQLTTRTGVPKMDSAVLKKTLLAEAERLRIDAPISDGKLKGLSTSAKAWARVADRSPWIASWVRLEQNAKLLEHLRSVDADAVYSRYSLLMRTGRTSAGAYKTRKGPYLPSLNAQQMPKVEGFRELFLSTPGTKRFSCDYSYLELRTLATCSRAKFGKSELADAVIDHTKNGGPDPHQRTAATLLSKTLEEFFAMPKDAQKLARQSAKACFHPDVEVLTRAGWVKVSALTGEEEVAQYWPGTRRVDYARPWALTTREDRPLVRVHNEGIDIRVTPDHRMLGYAHRGFPRVVCPDEMNTLRGIWNAGYAHEGRRLGAMTLDDVRRVVCIQADGSMVHTASATRVRFGFKKPRKIERFKLLFPEAAPTDCPKYGVTKFTVDFPKKYETLLSPQKVFRIESLLKMPLAWRQEFVAELQHWDGAKTGSRITYYSTVTENADAVQAVAATVGLKASVARSPGQEPHHADVNVVSIKNRDHTRGGTFAVDDLPGLHTVYCLTMPSSFVVVRDGGKTVCVGQCNFGFPGGLGVEKFVQFAAASYGVSLTRTQAKEQKKAWMDTYPDMKGWLADRTREAVCYQTGLPPRRVARLSDLRLRCLSDLCRGSELSEARAELAWETVWEIAVATGSPALKEAAGKREVTPAVRALTLYRAATPTGRVRANTKYTDGCNAPFQGLAADGAKEALWKLYYAGYRPVLFVHDEIVVDLPAATAKPESRRVEKIMNDAMESVLGGVPSAVEGVLGDYWQKG